MENFIFGSLVILVILYLITFFYISVFWNKRDEAYKQLQKDFIQADASKKNVSYDSANIWPVVDPKSRDNTGLIDFKRNLYVLREPLSIVGSKQVGFDISAQKSAAESCRDYGVSWRLLGKVERSELGERLSHVANVIGSEHWFYEKFPLLDALPFNLSYVITDGTNPIRSFISFLMNTFYFRPFSFLAKTVYFKTTWLPDFSGVDSLGLQYTVEKDLQEILDPWHVSVEQEGWNPNPALTVCTDLDILLNYKEFKTLQIGYIQKNTIGKEPAGCTVEDILVMRKAGFEYSPNNRNIDQYI